MELANKALPAAFANWRDLHSQRQQIRMALDQEMKERVKMLIEVCDSGSVLLSFFFPSFCVKVYLTCVRGTYPADIYCWTCVHTGLCFAFFIGTAIYNMFICDVNLGR